MKKILIFGHKKPDTDSVCSAICLSKLYNALKMPSEPRILSEMNAETKYILKKLSIKEPEILNDVKLQVSDINYRKDLFVNGKESVYNAFIKMHDNNVSTIPVVDNNKKVMGVFTTRIIANKEIMELNDHLKTNYEHILEVLDGKSVLKYCDEIEGKITNVDLRYNDDILNKETILVMEDNESLLLDAIKKHVKLIIVTNNKKIKEEYLNNSKDNKINIIYTKKDTYEVLKKLEFSSYIKEYSLKSDAISINESLDISDLNDIINQTKSSYYPVVDNTNTCLGLLKVSDLRDANPKKVVLVDHNELDQSVDGLDEADIIGIVDHHKLGNLGTIEPINFRNMTVGSTCTIVYKLYRENKIRITKEIGTLLLAGIISDTLLLKSPTTTKVDIDTFNDLVKLTKIKPQKLGMEMFKANDIINSKSIKEIVYTDFKTFNIDKKSIAIGQITTLNSKAILKQKDSYIKFLNKESNIKKYDIFIFVITDIFNNGSYLLFNDKSDNIMKYTFGNDFNQGDFIKDMISRKKQILPAIMNSII